MAKACPYPDRKKGGNKRFNNYEPINYKLKERIEEYFAFKWVKDKRLQNEKNRKNEDRKRRNVKDSVRLTTDYEFNKFWMDLIHCWICWKNFSNKWISGPSLMHEMKETSKL